MRAIFAILAFCAFVQSALAAPGDQINLPDEAIACVDRSRTRSLIEMIRSGNSRGAKAELISLEKAGNCTILPKGEAVLVTYDNPASLYVRVRLVRSGVEMWSDALTLFGKTDFIERAKRGAK